MREQDDLGELVRNDVQRFRELRRSDGGLDSGLPAMIELGFGSLSALAGLTWVLMLLWVPDPIDGGTWMGFGMLGLVLFGLPTGLIYVLRRGGAEVVREVVRGMGSG